MVEYSLFLTCDGENVHRLIPPQEKDSQWGIKATCQQCLTPFPTEWMIFSLGDECPISGSRGSANLVVKCKACQQEAHLTLHHLTSSLLLSSFSTSTYPIGKIESRGLKIMAWCTFSPWTVSTERTDFLVDLNHEEEDWMDYDDQLKLSVALSQVHFLLKGK
ncbi:hypothetical protein HMI54_010736 [Coelomomyces lativittatus]|nr:hypothetical protein HMI56_002839 [Coelomomyces lativittatus]KAJ1503529.1 hypothetical protein HMI55_002424 [Coelomomyces lativittatus]KAJ1516130.1 hypothetical protein HMI54_010736 [Coelomomyces lativittatus]